MVPVACRSCGARVLARKSSWNQTSVQWNADATARCAERREADRIADRTDHRGLFLACSALRDSIEAAVRLGELAVVDAQIESSLMHIAVTGGTGYVGAHIVSGLLAAEHSVTLLVEPHWSNDVLLHKLTSVGSVRVVRGDLRSPEGRRRIAGRLRRGAARRRSGGHRRSS